MIKTAITNTIATPPTSVLGAIELNRPGWTAGREHGPRGPAPGGMPGLAIKLRLADGRIHEGALEPERHRRIHLGLLHGEAMATSRSPPGRVPPVASCGSRPARTPALPARRRVRGRGLAGRSAQARSPPRRRR